MKATLESEINPTPVTTPTSRNIFWFYRPLALSWIFMAVESPICVGLLARKPDAESNIAAYFIMGAIALWIESPVIDLLATSTTLTKGQNSYAALSRFALLVMAFVTLVHAAVAFSPIYDLVATKWMGLEPKVASAARLGLQIMTPWSAFIGWRRYLQGILIRFGRTQFVGRGTFVRMSMIVLVGVSLTFLTSLPGIVVVAIALVCSVGSEAAYAHWVSRDVIRQHLTGADDDPVSLKRLATFHWPLTITTLLTLISIPLVAKTLSHAPSSTMIIAAWQVALTLLWLMRTIVYALPEVVISLFQDEDGERRLFRFSLTVGLCSTGTLLFLALTRLDVWFFANILRTESNLLAPAHLAFIFGAFLPLMGAWQCFYRGMLTAHHQTPARLWAIIVGTLTLVTILELTIQFKLAGISSAALAMNLGMAVELLTLGLFWRSFRRSRQEPALQAI